MLKSGKVGVWLLGGGLTAGAYHWYRQTTQVSSQKSFIEQALLPIRNTASTSQQEVVFNDIGGNPKRQNLPGKGSSIGTKTYLGLLLPNVAIFGAWRWAKYSPRVLAIMSKHFFTSVQHFRSGKWHTLLTSMYSHFGPMHLFFNMFGMYNFLPPLIDGNRGYVYTRPSMRMSVWEMLVFYHLAGLAGNMASLAFNMATKTQVNSLGASGALFGVLSYHFLEHPDSIIQIMFLIELDATTTLYVVTALNIVFAVFQLRNRSMIDGVAHLGGTAVGVGYHYLKRKWKKLPTRESLRKRRRSV